MGLFDDLINNAHGEPVWRDMFKWRCPRCNTILAEDRYPGPGREDDWFEDNFMLKHFGICGFSFGIDPLRAYYRCPVIHELAAMARNVRPNDYSYISCGCGKDHSVADLTWESAAEPLYLEKAARSNRRVAIERSGHSHSMMSGASNTPKRVIQRRVIQTADGTFAEETIVEF